MAEETKKPEAAAAAPAGSAEVAVEKPASEKGQTPAPVPEPEVPEKKEAAKGDEPEKVAEVTEAEKPKAEVEGEKVGQSSSFKEESNVVGELPEAQKKALDELKQLVQEALNKHEFSAPPPVKEEKPAEQVKEEKPAAAAAEETKVEETKTEESSKAETETTEKSAPPPPATEEKKDEKAPQPPPAEEKKEEKAPEPPAAKPKKEEKAPASAEEEEEKTPPPPAEAPKASKGVAEVFEKTVEAIKESIVSVVSPSAEPSSVTEVAATPTEEPKETVAAPPVPLEPEEVSIWGIPLLKDERSDTILLKFLRARDFKVKDAFTMLKNTVIWRKEFGIESLLEEDLGNELGKVFFMNGFDKEGHPVSYNAFSEFQNKELYQNTFSDEEKRTKFLKWWIQFLEKNIRKLDFSPSGICTIVQVHDLTNSPVPFRRDIRIATNQAVQLLQDNYPEFVARQLFINVPWWYLAFHKMISPFLTQRTKSKFVFSGPSKSAETLFKYITPEQVPVQYGGLIWDAKQDFTTADSVTEATIKPGTKHTIELPASEVCTLAWELRVLGWDVSYAAEFVPTAESSYTVIISKTRKVTPTDEPVISDSFKIGESGKVVLTIDNQTSKKKKLLYRSKTKPSSD